jgi:hypothetical protein
MMNKKIKHFRPYALARSTLKLSGTYTLPQTVVSTSTTTSSSSCNSEGGGGMLPNPDAPGGNQTPSEPLAEPLSQNSETKLGSIHVTQAMLGTGLSLQIPNRKNKFLTLFGEVIYNLPLKHVASNYGFANTKISNGLAINFGVVLGLKGQPQRRW